MLDSNTDRSYFMIGAIIVGALIIAGAILIFSGAFGEGGALTDMFDSIFNKAKAGVESIDIAPGPGIIVPAIKSIF